MSAVGRLEMALPTGGAPSLTKASASPRSRLAARSSQGEAAGSSARSPDAGGIQGTIRADRWPVRSDCGTCRASVPFDRPGHAPSWIALSLISGEEKGVASIRWTVAPVALVAGITVLAPAFLAACPGPRVRWHRRGQFRQQGQRRVGDWSGRQAPPIAGAPPMSRGASGQRRPPRGHQSIECTGSCGGRRNASGRLTHAGSPPSETPEGFRAKR